VSSSSFFSQEEELVAQLKLQREALQAQAREEPRALAAYLAKVHNTHTCSPIGVENYFHKLWTAGLNMPTQSLSGVNEARYLCHAFEHKFVKLCVICCL